MRASEPALRAAFRKIDVTPDYAVSLLGYFNDRVSTGVSDPLYCRLAAFAAAAGGRRAPRVLFVQIDTCVIANVAVYPDDVLPIVANLAGPDECICLLLSSNLYYLSSAPA
jgi:hypothetical protein